MVSNLQGWSVLFIILTHTAVCVHAGYNYSFNVVEGQNVHFPIPKHCLDGHLLLDNDNRMMAKFDRRFPEYYESRKGKLHDGCYSNFSSPCEFWMKVASVWESGTYQLYPNSTSEAPNQCYIVYLLKVWSDNNCRRSTTTFYAHEMGFKDSRQFHIPKENNLKLDESSVDDFLCRGPLSNENKKVYAQPKTDDKSIYFLFGTIVIVTGFYILLLFIASHRPKKKIQKETVEEQQVFIEREEGNTYETLHSSREYLTPVFEENPEGQTEGHYSNIYEEIECQGESITNHIEVVSSTSETDKTGSNFETTGHLLSNTNVKEVVGNTSDENKEKESNFKMIDRSLSNTNLKEVVDNTSNMYVKIDSNTHLKQTYQPYFLGGSTNVDHTSNMDTINTSDIHWKPEDTSIYYHSGYLPDIDVTAQHSHEYEIVTPLELGKPYNRVKGFSEDSNVIPCMKDSEKISCSTSENRESTSEETTVKQIYVSNTDVKALYNSSCDEIGDIIPAQQQFETDFNPNFEEQGRSYPSLCNMQSDMEIGDIIPAQQQFETDFNPNFEEQGRSYPSLCNMQSDMENFNQDSSQNEDTQMQGSLTDYYVISLKHDKMKTE